LTLTLLGWWWTAWATVSRWTSWSLVAVSLGSGWIIATTTAAACLVLSGAATWSTVGLVLAGVISCVFLIGCDVLLRLLLLRLLLSDVVVCLYTRVYLMLMLLYKLRLILDVVFDLVRFNVVCLLLLLVLMQLLHLLLLVELDLGVLEEVDAFVADEFVYVAVHVSGIESCEEGFGIAGRLRNLVW
jgi:hypothetical protein